MIDRNWGTCFLIVAVMFIAVQAVLNVMEVLVLGPIHWTLVLLVLGILVWKVLYPPEGRKR